ncbi:MAG: DUF1178 family protein [Rhodospirillales bacterium]|jgi:hypothetical protein|nr:DUF1178 family protein [Rhodospirillales bacterium]
MIVFNLRCGQGHSFEEWFASSADYDEKAAASALSCPECGDGRVEKGLTAPRINGGAAQPVGPCGQAACAAGPCQMLD